MTVQSTDRVAGPFDGNDVADTFPFTYKVFDKDDLVVIHFDENNVETTLVRGSGYSVALNADQDDNPGGSITYQIAAVDTALPTNETLVFYRDLDPTQLTDLTNQGGFFPQTIERMADKVTMIVQEVKEEVGRALRLNISDTTGADVELPTLTDNDGKYLRVNSNADGLELVEGQPAANSVFQEGTTDGTDTLIITDFTAAAKSDILLFIDGVYQGPTHWSYVVSTQTITLNTAAPNGLPYTIVGNERNTSTDIVLGTNVTYQYNVNADTRTVTARLQDSVSVLDFGADPLGVVDSTAAIHAAMTASKVVYFPQGTYLVSTLEIQQSGQHLIGATSASGGVTISPSGTDGITIKNNAKSDVVCEHIWIAVKGTSGTGWYQYGGAWLQLRDCTIYNSSGAGGTGITLDDRDDATVLVSGSYNHVLERLNMARGNFLTNCIVTAGTAGGINACRIHDCHFRSDAPIVWNAGGGNMMSGCILQSATGTTGTPVGNGVTIGSAGGTMSITGSYFEKYAADTTVANSTDAAAPIFVGHHSDSSTALAAVTGSGKYPAVAYDNHGVKHLTEREKAVTVSADGVKVATDNRVLLVNGNGAHRATAYLSLDNARDGQRITLRGQSWTVQFVENSTADFGPYSSGDGIIIGQEGSVIATGGVTRTSLFEAEFVFSNSLWRLVNAVPHRSTGGGGYEALNVDANGTAIATDARNLYITGNGAARINCTLVAPVVDGQQLTITANSWGVGVIPSTTAVFDATGGAPTFGSGATELMGMNLIGINGKWYETGRASNKVEYYTGSVAYDPPSLADGAGVTTTVTVTGAALGHYAQASVNVDTQGLTITAWVSAANTVSVRYQNETGGVVDITNSTLTCRAIPT